MALVEFFTLVLVLLLSSAASAPTSSGPQHIFLLAGQSNMVGHGGINNQHWDGKVPPQCQPHPGIFRLNGDSTWSPAKEPIHGGIFPSMPVVGIGPGMPFARRVLELDPTLRAIGLVPCAYDWTSIEEWSRGYVPRPGSTKLQLYKNLIARARASMATGGSVAGLLWWQGGKDAGNKDDADKYEDRLGQFFKDVRADLGMPHLPIIMIIIPRGQANYTDVVRNAQMSVNLPNLIKIDPPASEIKFESDQTHITAESQAVVGGIVGNEYCGIYCNKARD